MSAAQSNSESRSATGIMERIIRRLLEQPTAYYYGAFLFGLVPALWRHRDSGQDLGVIAILGALTSIWLSFWIRARNTDPTAHAPSTILLGFVGSCLVGGLFVFHYGFAILALSMMAQYFILLPFWAAILCGVPSAIGSEVSHRAMVMADPNAYPWMVAVVRTFALAVIGVSFKVLAFQIRERDRLQASLAAAERRSGMLEERQRLAREIHDTLAQGFASIAVHLERAEQIDSLVRSPARSHVELARSVAREGLEDARRMLAALRPEVLEQRALPEALERVCQDWSRRSGVPAELSITGAPTPLHPEIELTVLRAVQEGLTNIARHAEAKTVAVTLSYMEDVLVLDVQDDGHGFAPAERAGNEDGRGLGLAGMRERTEGLQGSFSVESAPGEGTTISITLPVIYQAAGEARANGGAA